jgi:hypothetical protein
MEVRTYDVRDLMILPDDSLLFSKDGAPATKPLSLQEQRVQIIEKLKQIIQNTVEPDSWTNNGGSLGTIQEFEGVLLVKQTPKAHAQIERVLAELRQAHSVEIAIESRIMFVDEPLYASLGFTHHADDGTDSELFNDTELSSILKQTQQDAKTVAVSTPRLTLFDGQAGFISVGEGAKQAVGIRLNIKAAASADRHSVILSLEPTLSQTGMAEQKVSKNVLMPDGGTLLLGGFTMNPNGGTDKSSQRRMILLVRPKIIIDKNLEKMVFGPPQALP